MRRLLVLRPEPGASVTLAKARTLGLDAIALPLFTVEPVEWQAPEASAFDALLLTSANALRHGGDNLQQLRHLPAYAVGEATAAAASAAGFNVVSVGDAGVDPLLASIAPRLRLLHLCGEHRVTPEDSRHEIVQLPVYRSRETADPDIRVAEGSVALIHSPRAALRFAELIGKAEVDRRSIAAVAISPAAAEALGGGWQAVVAPDQPSDDALLALAARLCNNCGRR